MFEHIALQRDDVSNAENFSIGDFNLAYGTPNLYQILHSAYLNAELQERGVTCYSLHPGALINTNIAETSSFAFRALFAIVSPFTKSIGQGASTTLYCALTEEARKSAGLYFADNRYTMSRVVESVDDEGRKRLYERSIELLQPWLTSQNDEEE